MAFVFKAERDISPEIKVATGDIGPGQYLPQGSIRTKGKISKAGFDSYTFRDTKIMKDDVPGPGSYTYDDKYEKFINLLNEKQTKSPSLLRSLEMVGPENLDPFTIIINKEKSKDVAFFSKEKRFKEKAGYDIPGPGEYNKHDPLFLVKNSIRKKRRKKNSQSRKKSANSLIRKNKDPASLYRLASIPSKNFCYGFDIDQRGELYIKDDPDKDIRYGGVYSDSVGPGAYDLDKRSIWNKPTVAWDKQGKSNINPLLNSQENNRNKSININNQNNSQLLEESLKRNNDYCKFTHNNNDNQLNNFLSPQLSKNNSILFLSNGKLIQDENSHDIIKTKNDVLISNYNIKVKKDKVFKYIRNQRQKLLDMKVSKSNLEDDLFDKHILNHEPGPGYYLSDIATTSFKPIKVPEKFQYFGSNSLRFSDPNISEKISDVGPGAYFKDDSKLAKEKLKQMLKDKNFSINNSIHREDIKRERNESIEERIGISGIINQHKLASIENNPGPGNYYLNSENFKVKNSSNLSQFGSLQKRFNDNINNPTPGPGSYLGMPKVESVNHIKFPIRPKKIIIKKDEEYKPNLSIFPKEGVEEIKANPSLPGVGTYNPDIVSSLSYKIAKNVNKFNNSSAPFSSVEKRFNSKTHVTATENVGPGQYYKDNSEKKILQNLLSNSPPFNTSADRKYPNEEYVSYAENGPGSYNLSSYFDWNKKSFNVQFI